MVNVNFAGLSRLDVEINTVVAAVGEWKKSDVFVTFEREGRRCDLLFMLSSGERRYYHDGASEFALKAGEAIYIPAGAKYTSRTFGDRSSEGVFIDFNLSVSGERVYITEPFRIFSGDGLEHRFNTVAENMNDRLRVRAELYRLLSDLSSRAAFHGLSDEDSLIRRTVLEIERHPEQTISVAELARSCCMSETGFRERFKRFTGGVTPTEYRNRIRCERAEELLTSGNFTVSQAAEMLGFWDTAHFYRMLRKYRTSAKPR